MIEFIKKIPPFIWVFIVLIVAVPFLILGMICATLFGTVFRAFLFGYLQTDGTIKEITKTASKFLRKKRNRRK